MILFCEACQKNHSFTGGEVERIVYTLQAVSMDALQATDFRLPEDVTPDCLQAVLGQAYDVEEYQEWSYNLLISRRMQQREDDPIRRGKAIDAWQKEAQG